MAARPYLYPAIQAYLPQLEAMILEAIEAAKAKAGLVSSMRDISIAVRAENRASTVFRSIASDVINLGVSFGALDSQIGRSVMQIFSLIRVFSSVKAIIDSSTAAQTAHTVATAAGSGAQTTLAPYPPLAP